MQSQPKLILHDPSNAARTPQILENRDWIESLPIDGMVINIPQSFYVMTSSANTPAGGEVTSTNIDKWLPQLADFNAEMENNYLITFIDNPGNLFDNNVWEDVVENFRVLAEAAREANFKGLVFDNEEYYGKWDNFPEDYPGASADDLEAYQAQASLRGRQIMEAIDEVFPEADMAVMHGPYTSVPRTNETPSAVSAQTGGSGNQELRGPFFTGLLEGMGDGQRLIDMGELYQLRSEDEFAASFEYRNETLPDLVDWNVSPDVSENWKEDVTVSHMVTTDEFPTGSIVTPQTLEDTLVNGLNNSEEVMFLYSSPGTAFAPDNIDFEWFRPGGVPQEWLDAVTAARERADNSGSTPDHSEPIPPIEPDPIGNGYLVGTVTEQAFVGGQNVELVDYGQSNGRIELNLRTGEGYFADAQGDTFANIEGAIGSVFDDLLVGGDEDNIFYGSNGDDEIYGNGGNDLIVSGLGSDVVAGGSGRDTASYAGSEGRIEVNLNRGEGYFSDADGDTLLSIENLIGSSHDDLLVGNGDANTLSGQDGDDRLYGNFGDDVLHGGRGADELGGGVGSDFAVYDGSEAAVTINLTEGTASGGDAAGDRLIGIENLRGSTFNDRLTGNWDNNVLIGATGDDVLTGLGGANTFVFSQGAGADIITDFDILNDRIIMVFEGGSTTDVKLTQNNEGTTLALLDSSVLLRGVDITSVSDASILVESSSDFALE